MTKWPHTVRPITRHDIQDAVQCRVWQFYRMSLKGLSTETKLDKLNHWLNIDGCCTRTAREVQVINYLNALRRGGLLNSTFEVQE